ncbi:hypothetical protein MTP99_003216 [Tenebrio molitor]|nr:hypothetical protein MTP99_003216 [Tenebrio molitor]
MSSIQDFYRDQTIFLTGATGFLGKLILEKLLRTCAVQKVYILVRPKHDKTLQQRFHSIFDSACFDLLRSSEPDFGKRVSLLSGDCSQRFLGLSEEARRLIKEEVTCIIHAAANVRFDTDLRTAVYTNVRSVKDLLELLGEVEKLRAFVYVSTAFSHCFRRTVAEEFYKVDDKPDKLLQMVEIMDDRMLNVMTPHILGDWPNTYVYTKALAEELIRAHKQTFPVVVVRPAIVTSTITEPLPGWIENFHGLVGVILGVSLGVLRSLQLRQDVEARMVPADLVVNNILAAAWAIQKSEGGDSIPIYNFTGCSGRLLTWGGLIKEFKRYMYVYPLSKTVWYPFVQTSSYKLVHQVRVFFFHTLFSYFVDCMLFMARKRPMAVEKYRKINKLVDVLGYFTVRSWNFQNDNVQALWKKMSEDDRKMFNFDMRDVDWSKYSENSILGGRLYLMNDSLDNVSKSKKKMYFLAIIHYVFIALMVYVLYRLLSPVVQMFL